MSGRAPHVERLLGLFTAACGLAFAVAVIPRQTEAFDYGALAPADVPLGAAWTMVGAGLAQAARPRGQGEREAYDFAVLRRAGLLLGLCVGAAMLMQWRGFVVAAPLLAAAVMLLVGERRPGWLAVGIFAVPALIWATVTLLLARPLP
ncbi:MAG: tripartite tricarboxylate transporter TctB family protein [Gammaproteobacteria bacterium]|nr:tripartite tricarboxylate transporter TctB family protein [Gammaproteobacteria bacterium]